MERQFIGLTAQFDGDKKPKKVLVPVDCIQSIWEVTAPIGGIEMRWLSGDTPTTTHFNEDIITVFRRLQGVEN